MSQQKDAKDSSRGSNIKRFRAGYNKRIDDLVDKLFENFLGLVRTSGVNTSSESSSSDSVRDNLQLQVHTECLVNAGELLLKVVQDMKQAFIVNDEAQASPSLVYC